MPKKGTAMSTHDAEPGPRLRAGGDEDERRLLASAKLDVPDASAYERTLAAALAAHAERAQPRAPRRQHARQALVALLSAGVVLLGIAALLQSGPQAPGVSAEPAASAPPHTRGAPALAACPRTAHAEGTSPAIDDFEDGNARLLLSEGRSGTWSAAGGGSGAQVPAPGTIAFPQLLEPPLSGSRYALHLQVSRLTSGMASLHAELAPRHCYDASAYAGIEFMARGTGRIYVSAMMIDVMEKKWGGLCDKDCYDQHMAPVDLEQSWQRHRVSWRDLVQVGYGAALPFDPTRLLSLDFSVQAPDSPAEMWLDDVRFVMRGE
jgi:hypothetical protein